MVSFFLNWSVAGKGEGSNFMVQKPSTLTPHSLRLKGYFSPILFFRLILQFPDQVRRKGLGG